MENVVPSHTIRRATMADQEALISIMAEAYTVSEPMAQALNVSKDDAEEFCRGFLPHYLSQGHSIVMESEGQIVGGYLLQLIERPNSAYESGPDPDLPPSVYTIECIAHKLTDNQSADTTSIGILQEISQHDDYDLVHTTETTDEGMQPSNGSLEEPRRTSTAT
ncbi:hypothetical protein Q1695_007907 [Nippostrongylus brasiliensis]|nr:hypothetical protein Q1695_007907 [Nippostrongylus brasiliensis]